MKTALLRSFTEHPDDIRIEQIRLLEKRGGKRDLQRRRAT